ncbi:terminase [Telmatospirillum sp.]|uniref:terminase n=1 Tax=Telmatospirillum sp. TaxID=2079197 RepID=UPI00283AE2DF|nr:terminase [Telmatospirillum sp.]MDR3436242.1 terminase [Telmatospirillum sp.]
MIEPRLLEWLASCNKSPLRFVLGAFPWGEAKGNLAKFKGPEPWQIQIMQDVESRLLNLNEAIKIARASGHGIGKSALVSWLILWAFTTAPDTRGVVTANTETQLKTKTWAELGVWFNRFVARDHFQLTATAILSRDPSRERTWRIDQVPWSEKNPAAFAGLHNQGKRILLVMDEASEIPDTIWEVAEGALTDADTEILWFAFGNPTRSLGRFRECFNTEGHGKYWQSAQIDSRSVSFTNKDLFTRWIETYGEDSDFVRIRVKGAFPRTGEMEFISAFEVDQAMAREAESALTDPVALGCDVARYGSNESVIAFRRGRDARTTPWEFYRGINTVELAARVSSAQGTTGADGVFIDGGGVGGGVVDNVRALGLHCWDVQFGGADDVGGAATGNSGEVYANKRAAMWGAMRAWIRAGGVLPHDPDLRAQLIAPMYGLDAKGRIQLEKKEDIMRRLGSDRSPDRADALALTFAYPLQSRAMTDAFGRKPGCEFEYNPFAEERMTA